ncbi:NADH-quinone oxidoreductase subunit NuoI [Thermosulfurimonas sp.]|uniref:NADH-quinone oxidoreductase subunit NuoI n=1 Tax=Thermosulfurimonas sp. TaxID=2080236 RepID=UPI0025E51596|nr:NADH-quinone oxidoreductase subunit NuoI [Thermosulfurimonas sp.]
MNPIRTIFLTEIAKGLWLTLRKMFSRPVTVQYPEERKPVAPGFRGRHALVRDPNTGRERCIGCLRCAKVCPSRCIYIETERDPETKRMVVKRYEVEALRCVFCGYCEEVCPVNAIVLTEFYEYVGYRREDLYFDKERLLANWDEFLTTQKRPYFNPYWKPRGVPEKMLPAPKRKAEGV